MQIKNKKNMSDAQIEESARLFSVLADTSRLKLLRALMSGPLTVTELVEQTGLKQGNASKHLGALLESRFVAKEKDGNFARYSIADANLYTLCQLMCGRIETDARQRLNALSEKNK